MLLFRYDLERPCLSILKMEFDGAVAKELPELVAGAAVAVTKWDYAILHIFQFKKIKIIFLSFLQLF